MSKTLKFDYSNLLSELKRLSITQEEFALGIGTNPSTLSLKLNNKAYFKQVEMEKACKMLNIPQSDIGAYFFVAKVQKTKQLRNVTVLKCAEQNDNKGVMTMAKDVLTDAQVEQEIERLKNSPLVKLAKKEEAIRYKRRQYLYCLRTYERKGRELQKAGITMEILEGIDNDTNGV